MTRIEALEQLIFAAALFVEDDAETNEAIAVSREMLNEVERQPSEVMQAVEALHRNGCVPVVWGDASKLFPVGYSYTPNELYAASKELHKKWEAAVSEQLHTEIGTLLKTTYGQELTPKEG